MRLLKSFKDALMKVARMDVGSGFDCLDCIDDLNYNWNDIIDQIII